MKTDRAYKEDTKHCYRERGKREDLDLDLLSS